MAGQVALCFRPHARLSYMTPRILRDEQRRTVTEVSLAGEVRDLFTNPHVVPLANQFGHDHGPVDGVGLALFS